MVCDAKLKACIYNWRAVAQSQSTNVGKCCPFRPLVTRWFVMMMGCDVKVKSMWVDGRNRVSPIGQSNRRVQRLPCRIFGYWWLGDWWCQGQVYVAEAELTLQSIGECKGCPVASFNENLAQWVLTTPNLDGHFNRLSMVLFVQNFTNGCWLLTSDYCTLTFA